MIPSPAAVIRTSQLHQRLALALKGSGKSPAGPPAHGFTTAKHQGGTAAPSTAQLIQKYAFQDSNPTSASATITRLASASFACGFSTRSTAASPATSAVWTDRLTAVAVASVRPDHGTTTSSGDASNPPDVAETRAVLEARLVEFASATLTGGVTWLVFEPTRGIVEVLNTPMHVSPLALGYYPLAAIDMSPEAVLALPSALDDQPAVVVKPPSWSRAARNKSIEFTAPTAYAIRVCPSQVPPSEQRRQHARRSVACLDWGFVASQLEAAEAWYASDARKASRDSRKSKLAAAASGRLPQFQSAVDVDVAEDLKSSATASVVPPTVADASTPDCPRCPSRAPCLSTDKARVSSSAPTGWCSRARMSLPARGGSPCA